MENKKMTKREFLTALIAFAESVDRMDATIQVYDFSADVDENAEDFPMKDKVINIKDEAIAYATNEISRLDSKAESAKNYKSATQKENENIKDTIYDVLSDAAEPMTVSEIIKDERLAGFTNQKISALLSQMREADEVVRIEDGKKTFFKVYTDFELSADPEDEFYLNDYEDDDLNFEDAEEDIA